MRRSFTSCRRSVLYSGFNHDIQRDLKKLRLHKRYNVCHNRHEHFKHCRKLCCDFRSVRLSCSRRRRCGHVYIHRPRHRINRDDCHCQQTHPAEDVIEKVFHMHKDHLRKPLKIGIPSAGEQLSYNLSQMIVTYFIAIMGAQALTTKCIRKILRCLFCCSALQSARARKF